MLTADNCCNKLMTYSHSVIVTHGDWSSSVASAVDRLSELHIGSINSSSFILRQMLMRSLFQRKHCLSKLARQLIFSFLFVFMELKYGIGLSLYLRGLQNNLLFSRIICISRVICSRKTYQLLIAVATTAEFLI
jgi:hypothetical protein